MSKEILLALAGLALLSGCMARRYDITLNNGSHINGVSKPRLDANGNRYVFKDAAGQENTVLALRVQVIEPHQAPKEPQKPKAGHLRR